MRREQSNQIRFMMEELLPPIVRDTALFKFVASLAWGKHISRLAEFRKSAPFVCAEEYNELYRNHPRVHEDTDNSRACLERIAADALGSSVCDVGCGTGAVLRHIRSHSHAPLVRMVGVDCEPEGRSVKYRFVIGWVEDLPSRCSFDTVICTQCSAYLNYRRAIEELRRLTRAV